MFIELALFIIGLILLIKGSDYFVKSAAIIAKMLGVSEFMIGLTLVALGTSIPELASSVFASLKHESGIIIGNVIGSNIANIGLILGIASLIAVIKTNKEILKRDGYFMIFVSFLFFIFAIDKQISWYEGIFFLALYTAYIIFVFHMKTLFKGEDYFKSFIRYFISFGYLTIIKNSLIKGIKTKAKNKKKLPFLNLTLAKEFLIVIISVTAVILGAKFLVDEAVFFANMFKIPSTLIGLSVIAIGTSLPELSVCIAAVKKGYGNIAVGNIIGSNIANILLILGVSSLISPISILKETLYYTIPFMIAISLFLLYAIRTAWKIKKYEGLALLLLYIAFIMFLFIYV